MIARYSEAFQQLDDAFAAFLKAAICRASGTIHSDHRTQQSGHPDQWQRFDT